MRKGIQSNHTAQARLYQPQEDDVPGVGLLVMCIPGEVSHSEGAWRAEHGLRSELH